MAYLHEDRTIWVTGAASGIGKAAAEEILSEGGCVVGSDLPTADFSWAEGVDRIHANL
jgi:NAD(P)-dependent dehydrogenase (short-subunit alcohol dehydrogenase family)